MEENKNYADMVASVAKASVEVEVGILVKRIEDLELYNRNSIINGITDKYEPVKEHSLFWVALFNNMVVNVSYINDYKRADTKTLVVPERECVVVDFGATFDGEVYEYSTSNNDGYKTYILIRDNRIKGE